MNKIDLGGMIFCRRKTDKDRVTGVIATSATLGQRTPLAAPYVETQRISMLGRWKELTDAIMKIITRAILLMRAIPTAQRGRMIPT